MLPLQLILGDWLLPADVLATQTALIDAWKNGLWMTCVLSLSISYFHFTPCTSLMTTAKRLVGGCLFWCVHAQGVSPAPEALAVLEDKMVAWNRGGLISMVVSDLLWGHGIEASNPDVKEHATSCIVAVSCCGLWAQPAPLECVSSIVAKTNFWFEDLNASKEPQLFFERYSVPFLALLMFILGVSELPATWAWCEWCGCALRQRRRGAEVPAGLKGCPVLSFSFLGEVGCSYVQATCQQRCCNAVSNVYNVTNNSWLSHLTYTQLSSESPYKARGTKRLLEKLFFHVASLQEQSFLQGCLFLGGRLGTPGPGAERGNKSKNRTGKSISHGNLSEQRVTEPIPTARQWL